VKKFPVNFIRDEIFRQDLDGELDQKIHRKRELFIIATVLLGLALFGVRHLWQGLILGLAAAFFSTVPLGTLGKTKNAAAILSHVVTPFLLIFSSALVFVYFPNFGFFFKTVLVFVFSLAFYAVLLTHNIFKVVAERGVRFPLFRAAQTTSFLLVLFCAFLFFTIVYKFPLFFALQALMVGGSTFLLTFSHLWLSFQDTALGSARKLVGGALLLGLAVGELALTFSFLPIKSFFRALALATCLYIGLGFYQQVLDHSFNKRRSIEYLVVAICVALILLIL